MILADLRTHLLGFVDLTTEIGDRIYINRAPQKAPNPYVIVSIVSGNTPYTLAGEIGVVQSIIQLSAWSRDPNGPFQASKVAALLRDKLSHWRGNWGDTFVNDCSLQGEPLDLADEPIDKSDNWWHGVQQDYQVTHAFSAPTLS